MVETLLYESEGTALDFKRDQYPFDGAADHEKAELLKDILAFANSFRTTDAHILIGVKEAEGGRAEVVGVTTHLKDANLQQFVNSKTNRTIDLGYTPVEVDGKSIGVIRIPKQQRPFYLKKNFGMNPADGPKAQHPLRADVVYLRAGSSTRIASPDDVYRMGQLDAANDQPSPLIDLTFADTLQRTALTREIVTDHVINIFPDDIPDYGEPERTGPFGIYVPSERVVNRSFCREAASYIHFLDAFRPIGFAVRNAASVLANDVVVELRFPSDPDISLVENGHMPDKPEPEWDRYRLRGMSALAGRMRRSLEPHAYIEQRGSNLWVVVRFGKVQAHELKVCETPIHLMSRAPHREITLEALIRADEIGKPQCETLTVRASATQREVSLLELVEMIPNRLYGSSDHSVHGNDEDETD